MVSTRKQIRDVTIAYSTGSLAGADKGNTHINKNSLTPLFVAKTITAITRNEKPEYCLLLGKQAIDDDCIQVGQMLAALLDLPKPLMLVKLLFLIIH